jgi:Ribosomal protein S3, C-terminal domain
MSKKTNPNIFRLGKTKNWNLKYFEKKLSETSIYSFKSLEIKNFIYKFFKDNKVIIHNCKINYIDENSIFINLSYYLTFDFKYDINLFNKKYKYNIKIIRKKEVLNNKKNFSSLPKLSANKPKLRLTLKKKNSIIKKSVKNYKEYQELNYCHNTLPTLLQKKDIIAANKIIKTEKNYLKVKKRLNSLKNYKKYLFIKNYKNARTIETNKFLSNFFESIHLFLGKKINIFLTIHQLNKNLKQNISIRKTKLLKLRLINFKKYDKNKFYKDGINLIFTCATQKNSANLLAQFIATQLSKMKRHKFFLNFIKATLLLFYKNNLSNIQGINIKIKGRFNGAPRAKHKIIRIGNGVPNLTIDSKIDYFEETAYTSNGTFGVKIWIHEKF